MKHSRISRVIQILTTLQAGKKSPLVICRKYLERAGAQAPIRHPGGLDKTFAQLQEAIAKKHKVNIRYHSLFEGTIIDVELCPYHLLYNNRAWYVLGRSSLHKSIRTFKLNRIKESKTTDKCFLYGENFDVYDYLGRAWSMIPEGRIYNICGSCPK